MNHAELLKRLLPPIAYDVNAPLISAELKAEGDVLDTAQIAADLILSEADPRTTYHLLSDWERVLGLPDTCAGQQSTIELRRAAVVSKVTMKGGQSRAFFIALAAKLGFVVTIDEFKQYSVMSPVNSPLYGWPWCFTWRVNVPLNNVRHFSVMSGVNESLSTWGNTLLECALNRFKPAHTIVQFAYS
jgi:uncharacterized protein YmfQ (DUF2313 family)